MCLDLKDSAGKVAQLTHTIERQPVRELRIHRSPPYLKLPFNRPHDIVSTDTVPQPTP